jgi:hypothetical protein
MRDLWIDGEEGTLDARVSAERQWHFTLGSV